MKSQSKRGHKKGTYEETSLQFSLGYPPPGPLTNNSPRTHNPTSHRWYPLRPFSMEAQKPNRHYCCKISPSQTPQPHEPWSPQPLDRRSQSNFAFRPPWTHNPPSHRPYALKPFSTQSTQAKSQTGTTLARSPLRAATTRTTKSSTPRRSQTTTSHQPGGSHQPTPSSQALIVEPPPPASQ